VIRLLAADDGSGVQTRRACCASSTGQAVAVETVLVCNLCRAETWLDGRVTQQLDVMTFCDAHKDHAEGHGFSVLLPLAQFGVAIAALPAGVTVNQLLTGTVSIVHAALGDMSSLCGQISPGVLLRYDHMLWGSVPSENRCPACDVLTWRFASFRADVGDTCC
jgi:hypothetical protein